MGFCHADRPGLQYSPADKPLQYLCSRRTEDPIQCVVAEGHAYQLLLTELTAVAYRTTEQQLIMIHAGLRGAIAFALALDFPSQNKHVRVCKHLYLIAPACGERRYFVQVILNTTMWVILFTIFVLGGTCTSALGMLNIEMGVESARNLHTRADAGVGFSGGLMRPTRFDCRPRRAGLKDQPALERARGAAAEDRPPRVRSAL